MIVMPSNNMGQVVKDLFKKYPDKIGMLNTPLSFKNPYGIHAFDNGCFGKFEENLYFKYLDKLENPLFIVCPDVVGCHTRTLVLWEHYYPILKPYGHPIAFVAQDGCEPEMVPDEADWIFIGGLDPWKQENIHKFIGDKPVHVGRVNGNGRLNYCKSLGVASVDGTGWLRQRSRQFYDFLEYFNGEKQCSLF